MPLMQIYLDEEEDNKVADLAHKYKTSKSTAIKQMIRACIIEEDK